MPYTRRQWQNDVTKLNAENMNNIEEGIEEAISSSLEALQESTNAGLKANKASQDVEKLRQDINYVKVSKESIEEALGYTPSDGDYNNLTNKPTIPSKITDLENDSTFVSEEHLNQKVTELTESKAEKSELTAQDNRIKLIENAYMKSVEYEPGSGIFRFTMQDGTIKTVDLAIEKVVTNFEYDTENTSLKLTLADGTVQAIPLSDFITDYTGAENDQIQVLVRSKNKIEAILKDNSVTLAKINDDVKEHFASKEEVASQLGDINTILDSLVEVEDVNLSTFTIERTDGDWEQVYEFKEGMTWEQFINSDYNIPTGDGCLYLVGTSVYVMYEGGGRYLYQNNTDTIIKGQTYTFKVGVGGNN